MKPSERLKEIEKFWNDDTGLIGSRETAICYAKNDITALIARVKTLEALTQEVLAQIDFAEHVGYIKQICEKALDGEE